MLSNRWHILTGEYPPQPGGVSDYTQGVAEALTAEGNEVEIWAPPTEGTDITKDGLAVHRLPDRFGPRSLTRLDRGLHRRPGRVLVQYTPHAFGWKGMNLLLVAWLAL